MKKLIFRCPWIYTSFWLLMILAAVYILVSILCASGAYELKWSLISVGILGLIHLMMLPIGYFGFSRVNKILLLFFVICGSIWTLLISIYLVLFIAVFNEEKQEFVYSSLHHLVIFCYITTNIITISVASMELIKNKPEKS